MYYAVYNENNQVKFIYYSQYSVDKLIANSEPGTYATNLDAFESLVQQSIGETQYSIVTEIPADLTGAMIDHNDLTYNYDQTVLDAVALENAKQFVADELAAADIQVYYHDDGDSRAIATIADWRQYRKDLREYVKNGAINGAQPTRPV